MKTAPDGRIIFIWRGRDLAEDTTRLTNAIAEACTTKLFELDGGLAWLRDGQLVLVSRNILHEVITKTIAGVRLVNHGSQDQLLWKCEFFSFDFAPGTDISKGPNDKVLTSVMEGLLLQVAKGPSTPVKLSAHHQQQQISIRIRQGERREQIAAAYNTDVATVDWLARQQSF